MSTANAIKHMKGARNQGATAVDFGGGEPTLREDILELTLAAAKLGYEKIGIKSNGMLFCYPEYVENLMRAGMNHFTVSIWGHTPAVHDSFSQIEGSFEMMEMGLKHLVDFGADVEADVLLTNETVPHLKELLKNFTDIGVRKFRMWLYCLFGSNYTLPELMPTLTAAGKAVVETAVAFRDRTDWIYTTHIPCCFLQPYEDIYRNIAQEKLLIITPGGSFPAEMSPFEAGVKTKRCLGCEKYKSCGGVRQEYIDRFSDRKIRPILPKKKERSSKKVTNSPTA